MRKNLKIAKTQIKLERINRQVPTERLIGDWRVLEVVKSNHDTADLVIQSASGARYTLPAKVYFQSAIVPKGAIFNKDTYGSEFDQVVNTYEDWDEEDDITVKEHFTVTDFLIDEIWDMPIILAILPH